MKAIFAVGVLLLSLIVCQAQESNTPPRTPDDGYTRQLVHLVTRLQENPWRGWESGTEVLVRYVVDRDAAGIPLGYAQPDLLYKVVEADKRFIRTSLINGKPGRQDFLVKDQVGLDAAWPKRVDASTTGLEMDGFRLSCLLSELAVREFPGGSRVTKQWTLASHPSVVLRQDTDGGSGWRVTSTLVTRKIGATEFPCVEVKKWMRFHSQGLNETLTTQYLCPDVPGHLVEEIQEFFKVKNGRRSSAPFQVVHQKVVELKRRSNPGRVVETK